MKKPLTETMTDKCCKYCEKKFKMFDTIKLYDDNEFYHRECIMTMEHEAEARIASETYPNIDEDISKDKWIMEEIVDNDKEFPYHIIFETTDYEWDIESFNTLKDANKFITYQTENAFHDGILPMDALWLVHNMISYQIKTNVIVNVEFKGFEND